MTAARLRTAALIVVLAGVLGAFTVGVLSRLAMLLLARLNPEADGVTSDDGFEMGRFTLSGSLNLLAVGVFLGLASGLFYLALERLRFGPGWFRVASLGVGAGVAAATQVVHSDGVDFHLLSPLWLAVGLFVAVPVVHVAALEVLAVRVRATRAVPVPVGTGWFAWTLRAGLVVVFVVAVTSLVGDVHDLTSAEG